MMGRGRGLLDIDSSAAKKYGDGKKRETDENGRPKLLLNHRVNRPVGSIDIKIWAKTTG